MENFRSGFAVLAGLPNAGKSTLLNALAGGLLSPVSAKPQMTRQNIIAVCEGADYQTVFVDTPGFLEPKYKLQRTMSAALSRAINEEADAVIFLADPLQSLPAHKPLAEKIKKIKCPLFLVINKSDARPEAQLEEFAARVKQELPEVKETFFISAKNSKGIEELKNAVSAVMPVNPPYFPPGQWTDRWEKFYAAEFIREQIFELYEKEVPYSAFVEVETFTEDLGPKNFIHAKIYVDRETQKPIIIGKGGAKIGELRKAAQKRIVEFLRRPYRLELEVAVAPGWRDNKKSLQKFGFIEEE